MLSYFSIRGATCSSQHLLEGGGSSLIGMQGTLVNQVPVLCARACAGTGATRISRQGGR